MKNYIQLLLPVIILLFAGNHLNGQCEPDPACIDTGDPGEICPYRLPDGMVNEAYESVITVIAPSAFTIDENVINVAYIVVDSIRNLPEGLTFDPGTNRFWADSADCVVISGTPAEEGEFPLSIYVTPWIYFGQMILPGPQVENDTSLVLTVIPASDLEQFQEGTFRMVSAFPNPFTETMHAGFFTPVADRIELEVFSILGTRVYREEQIANSGEGYFKFDGSSLEAGTYLYRIGNSSKTMTGKFIKIRK